MKQGMRQERENEFNRNRRPTQAEAEAAEAPMFPMRLNKYLAWKRQSSRRDMDKVIEEGRVIVNGAVAALGTKVNEGDRVEVRFHGTAAQREAGHAHAARRRRENNKGRR